MTAELIKTVLDLISIISVTILTVLLPVYVIAFSLVGPSAGRRKEEMDKISAEEAQTNKEAINKTKEALENNNTEDARHELAELENQKYQIEKKRKHTETRYSSLSLKQALFYPSILLIATAISFRLAIAVYAEPAVVFKSLSEYVSHYFTPVALIIVGFICLGYAVTLIIRTLSLIEELGRTVAEFNRQELSNVLTATLTQWEKSKNVNTVVEIYFRWRDMEPPFELKKDVPFTLRCELILTGINVTKDVELWFLLPPGFEFEKLESWTQSADRADIANFITAKLKYGRLQKKVAAPGSVTIIGKTAPGTYKGYYHIYSEDYISEKRVEFDLIVE